MYEWCVFSVCMMYVEHTYDARGWVNNFQQHIFELYSNNNRKTCDIIVQHGPFTYGLNPSMRVCLFSDKKNILAEYRTTHAQFPSGLGPRWIDGTWGFLQWTNM